MAGLPPIWVGPRTEREREREREFMLLSKSSVHDTTVAYKYARDLSTYFHHGAEFAGSKTTQVFRHRVHRHLQKQRFRNSIFLFNCQIEICSERVDEPAHAHV